MLMIRTSQNIKNVQKDEDQAARARGIVNTDQSVNGDQHGDVCSTLLTLLPPRAQEPAFRTLITGITTRVITAGITTRVITAGIALTQKGITGGLTSQKGITGGY